MIDLSLPAAECFQILRSYNYTVMLYDDDGNRVQEPEDARRMFAKPENMLLSVVEDGDDTGVRLFIGKGRDIKDIEGLVGALRMTATKFNLLFNVRRYGSEITPKAFSTKAAVREGLTTAEQPGPGKMYDLTEGMHGTSRSSYLKLPNARMIVRHSEKIDAEKHGARARHVESIFCENKTGERFLFPTSNLAPARAMTQHMNQGGDFADGVGNRIVEMAKEYSGLSEAARHIYRHGASLKEAERCAQVREGCRTRMGEMRRVFERLYRPSGYPGASKEISEQANMLSEGGGPPVVTPETIAEMREMLAVEGVDLAENMLECACRASREVMEAKKAPVESVAVLGKPVDKDAWLAFKGGSIEVKSKPVVPSSEFASRSEELLVKLRAVAVSAANDSIGNLLSFVADELEHGRRADFGSANDTGKGPTAKQVKEDPNARAKIMRVVGMTALKAAGVSMNDPAMKSEAITEFARWINSHSADRLTEAPYADDYGMYGYYPDADSKADTERENAIEELIDRVDLDEYLQSPYGGNDWFHWNSRDSLDAEEMRFTRKEILSSFQHWLEKELESGWDVSADLAAEAKVYVDQIAKRLTDAGYSEEAVAESMLDEDEELTREDVLLPSNDKGGELKRQIQAGGPDNTAQMTSDEMSRMRTLAGLR